MVEETTNPQRDFPRAFFIGITITGIVYMLVAFFTTALVPIDVLRDTDRDLLEVVRAGAPWFPLVVFSFIAMVAVGNTSLINLMMASRLLVRHVERAGDSARVRHRARAAAHAVGRDHLHHGARAAARELERRPHARRHDGAAAALRVRARQRRPCSCCAGRRSTTRTIGRRRCAPCSGLVSCVYLASPFAGRETAQYVVAGVLLLLGIALFVLNAFLGRAVNRQGYVGGGKFGLLAVQPLGETMAAQPQDIDAHRAGRDRSTRLRALRRVLPRPYRSPRVLGARERARHRRPRDGAGAVPALRRSADDLVHRRAHQGEVRRVSVARRQLRRDARLSRAAGRQRPVPGRARDPREPRLEPVRRGRRAPRRRRGLRRARAGRLVAGRRLSRQRRRRPHAAVRPRSGEAAPGHGQQRALPEVARALDGQARRDGLLLGRRHGQQPRRRDRRGS